MKRLNKRKLYNTKLFQPTDLLTEFTIDYVQFSVRHRHWDYGRMWSKFVRSN